MNFQQIIFELNQYWAKHGCVILQPYDMEVGAGTFHPATFLAAIGPEPSNSAYVQPSRRPTDGRYGQNPNRLQHYFQYQVVLKPSPKDFQELYIGSLRCLGINPLCDDIRFVEDDWESPTLGAWGLGWEVWLNGMEITQVTYFQQVGGLDCRPVTGEITYGLERIAMQVQEVDNVFDLNWNDTLSYGDLYLQNEYEQSTYNFEKADTQDLFNRFDACERQCSELAELDLALPAYERVLQASHTFNLLDARRVIGVTERARYIGRVRALARTVAETYYESREAKGFPRLGQTRASSPAKIDSVTDSVRAADQAVEPAPLLLELGTEELPPDAIPQIGASLEKELKQELLNVGLIESIEQVSHWYATPRRIAVAVENVKPRSEDLTKERRGPPIDRAYDNDGKPTAAALGFARSCGTELDDLKTLKTTNGSFLVFRFIEPGQESRELIPDCVRSAVSRLPIPKRMRWGELEEEFVRPVNWVLLLHGRNEIPFEIFSVQSGTVSRGHRFHNPEQIQIADSGEYSKMLMSHGKVIADWNERKQVIRDQISELEIEAGGRVLNDDSLLDQVSNLVEWPAAFYGNFDSTFLELPEEVLVTSMRQHQKYFPVFGENGALMPSFIGVANIEPESDDIRQRIVKGNERVLQARLSDAKFFWEQDCSSQLVEKLPMLQHLVFHKALGTVFDKSQRIIELASYIAGKLKFEDGVARRAALLCKADLVTEMVGEFPNLQGVMGRCYAAEDCEPSAVAAAVEEHYMPKTANDSLPASVCGTIVAVADRTDSLLGLMAVGEEARGDRDPYSLRRMALGMLRIIIESRVDLDLDALLYESSRIYAQHGRSKQNGKRFAPDEETISKVFEFMLDRLHAYYLDQGYAPDEFAAVYELKPTRPLEFDKRIRAVREFRKLAEYDDLIVANKRIGNILRQSGNLLGVQVKPELLTEPSERRLYDQALDLSQEILPLIRASDHREILRKLSVLRDPIDKFFDEVMVMDEDMVTRKNRVALVGFVTRLFREVADISQLQPMKADQ